MSAALRVISPGARSLVQDTGFRRGRALGLPRAGVLDRDALFLVNALLDNGHGAEAVEIAATSPVLIAQDGSVRVALSGSLSGRIVGSDGGARQVRGWSATTLRSGETLRLDAPARGGLGLLGIGGGLDLPELMGSRATYARGGFGGLEGRRLAAGDVLPVRKEAQEYRELELHRVPDPGSGPIRVVLGPQRERFTGAAIETLLGQGYTVTTETDRMGMRLDGPALEHVPELGGDIISDGTVPGAIQVPGNGKPIVLLADAQTTGGYAKIATVISADFSRLARTVPRDLVTFEAVGAAQAEAAARAHRAALERAAASVGPARGGVPDAATLASANLIGGVVDMARPDHFPGALETG